MSAHYESDTYRSVDITHELATRVAQTRDESKILLGLTLSLAEQRNQAFELLADRAMTVTKAGSAGVSIRDVEGGADVFRWVSAVGAFSPLVFSTMPRHFSPCGDAVRTGQLLLLREPAQHYPYILELPVPVFEVLLSPLMHEDEPIGTVWAAHHEPPAHFDAEDGRLLNTITTFVSESTDLLERLSFGNSSV